MTSETPSRSPAPQGGLVAVLAPGIEAVRAYWRPFLAIQVATAAVVVAYYASPAFRAACAGLAHAKAAGGLAFSATSGAIAGGIMPELSKLATMGARPIRALLFDALWNGLIFAIIGVQVDLLYQYQAHLFGAGHATTTLIEKIAVDQGIYTTLMSIPLTVGMVRWRSNLSSPSILFGNWTLDGYRRNVAPNLPTAWAFWIPVLVCVYSMPITLQFCLSVLAEAAWSLLFGVRRTTGARSVKLIGVDVGGTKTSVVMGTDEGEILEKSSWPSFADPGPKAMIERIVADAVRLNASCEAVAIGVAIGGPMNAASGTILSPPNLPGWDDVPLKVILEERLHLPATVHHDAAACALAEWRWGAGRGLSRVAYLTCGTGFGVGLVVDGIAYYGAKGETMEIGHLPCVAGGPEAFGKAGCFEAVASLEGLSRLATHLFPDRWPTPPKPREIAELAASGDPQAKQIIADNARYVGIACSVIVDMLGAEVVALGTAAMRLGPSWVEAVRATFALEALPGRGAAERIASAGLGERLQDLSGVAAAMPNG